MWCICIHTVCCPRSLTPVTGEGGEGPCGKESGHVASQNVKDDLESMKTQMLSPGALNPEHLSFIFLNASVY